MVGTTVGVTLGTGTAPEVEEIPPGIDPTQEIGMIGIQDQEVTPGIGRTITLNLGRDPAQEIGPILHISIKIDIITPDQGKGNPIMNNSGIILKTEMTPEIEVESEAGIEIISM